MVKYRRISKSKKSKSPFNIAHDEGESEERENGYIYIDCLLLGVVTIVFVSTVNDHYRLTL